MKRFYAFVAGNSRVTPVGIAAAVVVALTLRGSPDWAAAAYLAVLIATLAACTLERVQ